MKFENDDVDIGVLALSSELHLLHEVKGDGNPDCGGDRAEHVYAKTWTSKGQARGDTRENKLIIGGIRSSGSELVLSSFRSSILVMTSTRVLQCLMCD